MTIDSIATIRYSLKLLFRLNQSIATLSKNPDRVARALKDMERDQSALAEFDKLVHFEPQFDCEG